MKKLFISQPMKDKTDAEILAVREQAIQSAKNLLGEDVEVIDSFFQNVPHDATRYGSWQSPWNCWQPLMWCILPRTGKSIVVAELKTPVPLNTASRSLRTTSIDN